MDKLEQSIEGMALTLGWSMRRAIQDLPAYDQRYILVDDGLDEGLESLDEVGLLPCENGVQDGAVLLAQLAVGGAAGGESRQLRPQRGHGFRGGGGGRRRHDGWMTAFPNCFRIFSQTVGNFAVVQSYYVFSMRYFQFTFTMLNILVMKSQI